MSDLYGRRFHSGFATSASIRAVSALIFSSQVISLAALAVPLLLICIDSHADTTTTSYQYDELGRVKSVNYNNTVSNTYSYDAADNRIQKQSLNIDTSPPSAPGTITISGITQTSANASWGPATDNAGVTTYEYRLNGAAGWTALGNYTSLGLAGLLAGTNYALDIHAKDAAGNIGPSSSASFTTLANTNHAPICTSRTITMVIPAIASPYPMSVAAGVLIAQCTDADGDTITLTSPAAPVTFTLAASQSRAIPFTVSDGKGGVGSATLTYVRTP